jgi:hypothetical protein
VVHAAIAAGGLAEKLVLSLQRLANFEDGGTRFQGSKETT